MRIRMKKKQQQNSELELQEDIQELSEELEEEFPDPIEIPEAFPEDFSEDMETDVPDAPEPRLKKKNVFGKIISFFKNILFQEEEELEEIPEESENNPEEFIEDFSEEDLEDDSAKFTENFSEDNSEEFTENFLENNSDELPEIIPEDESENFIETQKMKHQVLFPELDENELEITPDLDLPDLEYMDDVEDLLNLTELDELEDEEETEELADAPEMMPDSFVANFESGDMILNPEENNSSDNKNTAPKSEVIAEKPKPNILGKLIPAMILIVLVAIFVVCFRNGAFDEKEVYYMPNLVGLDYYNLPKDNLNLDIQVDNSELSGYDKNIIYEQDIPAGEVIDLGQTVHVNVSLGFAMEVIPDVRNYQLDYAKKMLEQAGFKIDIQYEMSLGGTKTGNVIRTEPEIGQKIVIGTVVTVYVSQGSDNTSAIVPNLLGMSLEKAITLCEESGLTVDAVPVASLEEENTVISQNLEPDTQVDFGTIIVINYSNAEAPAGTVDYQLNLPAYANGRFTLDFINQDGTVIDSDTLVAGFSAGSAISVEGYGAQQITVVLNNDVTAQQAEIGVYDFDFTTGIYNIITEDVQKAFEDVNGIG